MWDTWLAPAGETFPAGLVRQFDRTAQWAPHIEAGHWPDADMLPLGYLGPRPGWGEARMSRLTADESKTLMTLWSMARSPLVAGTNLTRMDAATEALYTNPEVIAVDQHSRENRELSRSGSLVVWTAVPESGEGRYVAVFNLGDAAQEVNLGWKDLGLPEGAMQCATCGRARSWARLVRLRGRSPRMRRCFTGCIDVQFPYPATGPDASSTLNLSSRPERSVVEGPAVISPSPSPSAGNRSSRSWK